MKIKTEALKIEKNALLDSSLAAFMDEKIGVDQTRGTIQPNHLQDFDTVMPKATRGVGNSRSAYSVAKTNKNALHFWRAFLLI